MTELIQKTLFEENYLIRTLGSLAHRPDIALTELVANAWDAGSLEVNISIPKEEGGLLLVEDDGTGMTPDQFRERWMKLGYNRMKHQGKEVIFPVGRSGNRKAYGRNGVGRHGLLCFNDEYKVITASAGQRSEFVIATASEESPFIIKSENVTESNDVGTRLEVKVIRNLPNESQILDIISARFLHDPEFTVKINGKIASLETHSGVIKRTDLKISENITIELLLVDSTKPHRKILYQGVAIWQDKRLVGEPSWILGKNVIIDGRTRMAKQFIGIAKTTDLGEFVKEDWTGFIKHETMDLVYEKISECIDTWFQEIAQEHISDTREEVEKQFLEKISQLSPLGRYEVNEFVDTIAVSSYSIQPGIRSRIIETFINLENSRNGRELLQKISLLSDTDVAGLNRLLDQWTVKDALLVLDEIDLRLTVIEAIKKLSSDADTDELKVLHPLITEARWVFGPEFDSPEYISNRSLQTAVKEIFRIQSGSTLFENPRKRPDIVICGNSTLSVTGTEDINNDTELAELKKVLIIELKHGGFEITRKERDQAVGYTEDFTSCGSIIGNPYITTFIVGHTISPKLQPIQKIENENKVERGIVRATTFSQLVDTAEKRLFRLRDSLNNRYDDLPGMELAQRVFSQKLLQK